MKQFKPLINVFFQKLETNLKSTLCKASSRDKIQWRPPSVLFVPLILCGSLVFFTDVLQLQPLKISTTDPQRRFMRDLEDTSKAFLIKTGGCQIPYMEAFGPSVAHHIYNEPPVVCNNGTPPLIESNFTSLYLLRTSLPAYGISNVSALKCCYSVLKRVEPSWPYPDNNIEFSKMCIIFNHTATIKDEFVQVICSHNGSEVYKDFFSFVPVKPKIRRNLITNPALNVLIIGLDGVSRLNLHRQMPKTVQILREVAAVEFLGYNKVGDNTFPNLIPVLTGLSEEELVSKCWRSTMDRFDDCPFLWKNFSENGFATAFGKDSARIGIFNYLKLGFDKQPTDYFWGPFDYIAELQKGNALQANVFQCIGARLVYKILLQYIDNYVRTMHVGKQPHFGFFWGSSLSHDYLNRPKLGDNDYATFFNKLQTNGILNNTVLIFMSDHGIRWGRIRTTNQGRMEERLPFLFIALPGWYQESYHQTYINLKINAKRLTTPFDLHETLKDLLNPHTLTQEALRARINNRSRQRGYSLFEPVPINRTCNDAAIASHWCTCQQSTNVDKDNPFVVEAAKFTVTYINNKLEGYASCANLALAEIYDARLHSLTEQAMKINYTQDYTIGFKTKPGAAMFEATVRQFFSSNENYSFSVIGTISRINLYGKQSLCITDFHLKLYCYCDTYYRFKKYGSYSETTI